jgi:hypothetical protein
MPPPTLDVGYSAVEAPQSPRSRTSIWCAIGSQLPAGELLQETKTMPRGNLAWKLSADRLQVCVEMHIDGEPKAHVWYDAASFEDNIQMLGEARAAMAEQVTPDLEHGMRLKAIADPRWQTETRHDMGGVMLALRHPGLGWVSFLLPPNEARALGNYLVAQAGEIEPPPPIE